MKKVLLRQNSKDIHVKDYFGAIDTIPDTLELDTGISNPIEQPGAVNCTAISACDVCANQVGTLFDVDDLWALTPKSSQGATPQDSLGTLITHGLKPLNGGPRDTRWVSYFRSDGTKGDYFVTTQTSMVLTKSSTTVACNFYAEWLTVGSDGVLPKGETWVTGHDFEVTGWRQTPTGPQFHVKFWTGHFVWMPKDVYNEEMDRYGTGAYIPSSKTVSIGQRTLLQTLLDAMVNLCLLLQQKLLSVIPSSGFPPILYTVAKNSLGTKQTLNDSVPSDVGCSEAVSALVSIAGVSIPAGGIAGTSQMYTFLQHSPRFLQIAAPEVGAIIISPTSSTGKIAHGHVGVLAMFNVQYNQDWGIISNDSDTGLVHEQWCLKNWINYYHIYGELELAYFRLVG